ncbi:MAG: GTPase HflX [Pseudomonadota bacterium]|nr:GTPase HflX [Pseudomonadota bacterium]
MIALPPRVAEKAVNRPRVTGRALVIGPYPAQRPGAQPDGGRARSPEARLEEAVGLAKAIDLEVAAAIAFTLATIRPATYLGSGKVEELKRALAEAEAELAILDCALSPVQQRNLERAWSVKVLDRTGLILEIFGRRARTREGGLQVELAHLTYQKSRLVRSWTHLERQRGGFGFLGGPGETQREADRRMIQERIDRIEKDLESVRKTRALHRRQRRRAALPTVALVGYTNAGKSTLFNRLTDAGTVAADMLFATLDPTLRAVGLPRGGAMILSDTVGFISDLPTQLVAAFRATLEEVTEADLILHVRDIAHPDTEAQAADVRNVLAEIGIDEGGPVLEVWNKIDTLPADRREALANAVQRQPPELRPVAISALTGEGMDTLLRSIEARLGENRKVLRVTLDAADGATLNWLYENCEILDRRDSGDGHVFLAVRADESQAAALGRRLGGEGRPGG